MCLPSHDWLVWTIEKKNEKEKEKAQAQLNCTGRIRVSDKFFIKYVYTYFKKTDWAIKL